MSEWHDIATAPKDGTRIILTDGKAVEAGCYAPSIHGDEYPWAFVDDYSGADLTTGYVGVAVNAFKVADVTHWMPLPAPPQSMKGKDHG
jgi:hypothetical protein